MADKRKLNIIDEAGSTIGEDTRSNKDKKRFIPSISEKRNLEIFTKIKELI